STSKSPLFKQNKARVGSVGIDNVEYETKINCDEFLGMTVGYYISTKTDEIAFVGKETRYNKTLVLKDNQIEQFANQVYTYRKEDGGIRIKAVLATPCYVNYNGLVAYDFDMSNMIPKIGEVRLVDNNLDDKYDVSFIINNEIKVIQMVDEAKKTMFFRDGTNVKLTDGEYKICNHGGKDLALSNFVPGDIVYYSASENSKFVYIGIIRKKISGKPKYYSKDENSGRITVEIDGKRYESVNGFYKNTEVTVNRSYVFYFDNEEKIVAILSGIESDVYGYLVQAQILERDELHMKVYSQNNTMQILKVAKRVLVDGVQRKDAKTIKADLNKGAREDQIIKYSLNNEGEISKIDTAYNLNANYQTTLPTDKEDKNSLRVEYSSTLNNEGALSYRSGMKSLGGKVSVDSGTIIFQVPKVLNGADDKDFIVGSMSNLVNEDSYIIDSYSDSEVNAVAKVMVAYGEGFGDKKDYIGVLMSEASVLTEQGEGTKLVFSGPPGVEMSAINYDMDLEKVPGYWGATGIFKADVGDIVRAYIVNGELKLIQMVYDYENEKVIPCPSERAFGGMQRYEFGSVYSKLGEYISITSKNLLLNGSEITSADLQYYNISQFKMIKVDKDNQGTIEAYETTDDLIMDYKSNVSVFSKVFVYSSYGSPWLIVVYD
ncbi:MAG: hypothetical protein RR145_02505, partial [Oscillospiraceae bacterium]